MAPADLSYADAAANDIPESPTSPIVIDLTGKNTNGHRPPDASTSGEYSGERRDESPRTTVKGLERLGSRSSKGALGRQPVKEATQNIKTKKKRQDDDVFYEKVQNSHGHHGHLTSVKASPDYTESLELDKRQSMKISLKSGRVPSAGWELSG
jgi:hypothetical protein